MDDSDLSFRVYWSAIVRATAFAIISFLHSDSPPSFVNHVNSESY